MTDGWAQLIDRLLLDLEAQGWRWTPMTRMKVSPAGGLRFEPGNPDNPPSYEGWPCKGWERIVLAEEESARCMDCGGPGGRVVIDSWVHTLCAGCVDARRGVRV